jgi:type IV pilus assembly protein PilC
MEFICRLGAPNGQIEEKVLQATDEPTLRAELERGGYYIISIRRSLGLRNLGLRGRRIPYALLVAFGQEMTALLKAGLPLFQALDIMLERQRDPVFRLSLTTVRDKVKSGQSLSEAFRGEGSLYPPIFAASLVAGERSGSLETVMRRFVQYLRLTQGLKRKAITAAVYPAVLFAVMVVLVAVLLIFVIPKFEQFFSDFDLQLPLITRLLMWAGRTAQDNLYLFGATLLVLVFAAQAWLRREGSAQIVDRLLLRLPYLGRLMQMFATGQLARTLSTLLAGGLPLLNSLEVAAASIGNRALARAVALAIPQIREGKSLTTTLESTGMVENLALEMVKVGEQTGALADMLNSVAEFYDEELEIRMATVISLVEPAMLVMMAIIVAGMLLAFYLPLFQSISAVQQTV